MSLDQFMQLYVTHVNSVIVWLALTVLALVALYLLIALKDEKLEFENAGSQLNQLEETLKKVLESTPLNASTSRQVAADLVEGVPTHSPQLEELKRVASERDQKITELQKKLDEVLQKSAQNDPAPLQTRLTELEAKLAEYEIVEDDIANLSIYKDENVRLKDEIDRLRNQAGITPPVAETPAPAAAATDDLMAEFEASVASSKETPSNKTPVEAIRATGSASTENPTDGQSVFVGSKEKGSETVEPDVMSQFETAVKSQSTEKENQDPRVLEQQLNAALKDPADHDLMAEFAAAVEEKSPEAAASQPMAPPVPAAAVTPPPMAPTAPPAAPPVNAAPSVAPVSKEAENAALVRELEQSGILDTLIEEKSENTAVASVPAAPSLPPSSQGAEAPKPENVDLPPALAEEVDTDQMLSELENFQAPEAPAEDEQDEGEKLIAEFENFVKGAS